MFRKCFFLNQVKVPFNHKFINGIVQFSPCECHLTVFYFSVKQIRNCFITFNDLEQDNMTGNLVVFF